MAAFSGEGSYDARSRSLAHGDVIPNRVEDSVRNLLFATERSEEVEWNLLCAERH
jgi:hypothetical protein